MSRRDQALYTLSSQPMGLPSPGLVVLGGALALWGDGLRDNSELGKVPGATASSAAEGPSESIPEVGK